jgi:hypothetical protein
MTMRFICSKYPGLVVQGKGYRVKFEDGAAEVDGETAEALAAFADSDAGQAAGIEAVDRPVRKAAKKTARPKGEE